MKQAIRLIDKCPFCGKEAKIIPSICGFYYKAGCETPKCRGWVNTAPNTNTTAEAMQSWQKRAIERWYIQAFDGIRQDLREAIEDAKDNDLMDEVATQAWSDMANNALEIVDHWQKQIGKEGGE